MYKTKKKKKVKKFRKKFNTKLIKARKTYSIDEISELFNVHPNTVGTWRKLGLKTIDNNKPYLFFGSDLKDFIKEKNNSKKHPCALNELFCCKCQKPRKPKNNIVCIKQTQARTNVVGFCNACGTKINKTISPKKIDSFKKIFHVQTVHEENLIGCTNTCTIVKKKKERKND